MLLYFSSHLLFISTLIYFIKQHQHHLQLLQAYIKVSNWTRESSSPPKRIHRPFPDQEENWKHSHFWGISYTTRWVWGIELLCWSCHSSQMYETRSRKEQGRCLRNQCSHPQRRAFLRALLPAPLELVWIPSFLRPALLLWLTKFSFQLHIPAPSSPINMFSTRKQRAIYSVYFVILLLFYCIKREGLYISFKRRQRNTVGVQKQHIKILYMKL